MIEPCMRITSRFATESWHPCCGQAIFSFYLPVRAMYSINDRHEPVDDATTSDNLQTCKAIDMKTGEICGETEGLRILDEFQKLYEAQIEKIHQEIGNDSDRAAKKVQIMTEWIKDLGEQNKMLVHTVEDLEQAACSRLKLLEDKLKQSSCIVSENITRSTQSEESLNVLSNRITQLERDDKTLQQRIEFLQSDIRGLLELIRRGCHKNCWDLNDITFFEVQLSDIPVPLDCTCNQKQADTEKLHHMTLQVEQLQRNEKEMLTYQSELEKKLVDLSTELSTKEKTIQNINRKVHCLCENLKKRSKIPNRIVIDPTIPSESDSKIILMAELVESVLSDKELEVEDLHKQLEDVKSKITTTTIENDNDIKKLQTELEDKCEQVQELELRMASLQKEFVETREALTAEVLQKHNMMMSLRNDIAVIEEQNRYANLQTHFKDDIIKELRKTLKQVSNKDMNSPKRIDNELQSTQECNKSEYYIDRPQDKIMSYLINTKLLMEKEKSALYDLKTDLEKIFDIELNLGEKEACPVLPHEMIVSDTIKILSRNIHNITKICLEKEKSIVLMDYIIENSSESRAVDTCEYQNGSNSTMYQQYRLMEEFRVCTVEAQAATEDIREEMSCVVSVFKSRNQKRTDINKAIINVQDKLANVTGELAEIIDKLENEERIRLKEKVINGKTELKEVNRVKYDVSRHLRDIQESIKEHMSRRYTEACKCSGFLDLIIRQIEQVTSALQTSQSQVVYCNTPVSEKLKHQFRLIDYTLKEFQAKTNEMLSEDELMERTFQERERKLGKLEDEVDSAHVKMQEVLETITAIKEQEQKTYGAMKNQVQNQNISQLFKFLQDTLQSTRSGLENLKMEFMNVIHEGSNQACSSADRLNVMALISRIQKYEENINDCIPEIERLKNTLSSKDKLLINKDEIINIQKDSITMTQKELKELHKKFQEKIDEQNQIISDREKENKELSKQNELQVQTIRHLQDAVVEAKRCLDHMNYKASNDVSDLRDPVSSTTFNHRNVHDV